MAIFIILSRIAPETTGEPKDFNDRIKAVSEKIKQQCRGVTWKESYATLGHDAVDIVEATDPKEVEKMEQIIRACGHASTETLVITRWKDFLAAL